MCAGGAAAYNGSALYISSSSSRNLQRAYEHVTIPVANKSINLLEMWANAQPDGRLPNIGGALCSTPQSLADARCWSAMQ